jgi:hypothetical protein
LVFFFNLLSSTTVSSNYCGIFDVFFFFFFFLDFLHAQRYPANTLLLLLFLDLIV